MTQLPWYIGGPLIGFTVPLLLVLREKQLGVSSSYRVIGSYLLPRLSYFRYDRIKDLWQLHFVLGIIVAATLLFALDAIEPPKVNTSVEYGRQALDIYSFAHWPLFLIGGIFLGFGARYADGCTAGHCIMGNALFARSSLVTTLSFFAGGLLGTYFIIPLIASS